MLRLAASQASHGRRALSSMPAWATVDPFALSGAKPATLQNLVQGEWQSAQSSTKLVDPLNGEEFITMPTTTVSELGPFLEAAASCPKTGLHNPLKNVERYRMLGDVSFRMAEEMRKPEVEQHLVRLIQRVVPKANAQVTAEVRVTRQFLENFGGDQVRFLARGFTVPGDHLGQQSTGYRWPYGPVALIYPFNFPLEIPLLQLMGALYMGNKVAMKACSRTGVVMEEILRLMHHCGLPKEDIDFIYCGGAVMQEFLMSSKPRMTQFTGSSTVAEGLARDLHGKIRIEDAGFDWKVLGPDVGDVDYVSFVCDQDAYGAIGQKCSAQSALFVHNNWEREAGLLNRLAALADRRKLEDLSCGPLISVTNEEIEAHLENLLAIPGAQVLWGGQRLTGHSIPERYGSFRPTAVYVPIEEMAKPGNFEHCTTEIFGGFQVVTTYEDADLPLVLELLERMEHHLTAAIVSNDSHFVNKVSAHTVNGTTYTGRRARTTGAPQNHWFGPAGDPRGAGIGTPEAIKMVWSCHREIISDPGPVEASWTMPEAS